MTEPPCIHGRLSVAPMMEWTTPPARYVLRLLAPNVRLYTEMVPAVALWHGAAGRFLPFHPAEHPVAVQFGGSDPQELAHAARLAERWGYDEVNLNVGCPSDRVQSGRFGACLMLEPARVADCVAAMQAATRLPVTVKTRIGVDDHDSEAFLDAFVEAVAAAGCRSFIVHARKAWLSGLSPKENREIPPLDYLRVHRLKARRPDLEVAINGGIADAATLREQLQWVDGAMIGREAFSNPYVLAQWDCMLFGGELPGRRAVVTAYLPYVEARRREGVPMSQLVKVLMGLFNGLPGARAWRRTLTEGSQQPGAGPDVIERALKCVAHGEAA
ncbi:MULTISPECIES: tRNA dihydrouridine(20/20a) synthase DusA [Halorhodospira]|uniref:tRNA dihydrouridine(20/20a) synthase DusA n=1 Tax=Halorhodospira TaxID=85108 RepID=UPI001EE8859C|nr:MULTISPECIES: tRNA dihydrouridine(20/20a) synthase DusA [Halorhodospira]MCG5528221.1 tRNA dihydrouridine(20/20a) synthase DusA [Halorhodospira halophila]MCG5543878.1 tRNA dihydrouridine(20/20a) synthase DusA [Halorhodospira sp. 9628]